MADELIENLIPNSPYSEPNRHFKFGIEDITDKIVEPRLASALVARFASILVMRRPAVDIDISGILRIPDQSPPVFPDRLLRRRWNRDI